jgi:hydroxymethylglutaryl-CoA synthase
VPGYEEAANRIGFSRSLEGGVTLTREQYEALHDGTELPALAYTPKDEFAIARVGKSYGASFQDLGVEYYDFVQ